ncbi:MAG: hypothetical protein Q8K79_03785 [Solirubrobacteraceae bacterium]|nr:hypothetical protein [Solirubrobacteraceae bacterium]
MLRNLIDEVRNRQVLALAGLGVLVALALPLLFLKGAPAGAPQADVAAPAAAKEAKLPPRAARLLATDDPGAPGGQAKGSAQDPFAPPASYRAAAAAATKAGSGSAPTTATPAVSGGGAATITKAPAVVPGTPSAPRPTTPRRATPSLNANNASVDIRFGPKANTRIKRSIRRQKGLYVHGKLVAMFVKYSPARKAAVFALAPGLHITGPTKCRVVDGSCRYLDIPAGEHAWITTITANRTIVSRRLDVVRIKRRTASSRTRVASASARSEAACLARKLVAMKRGDALLGRDACKRS